jgi:hypothetical protein
MDIQFLKVSGVRKRIKHNGKRVSEEFILALDAFIRRKIDAACRVHNGGKKTLDASIAGHVFGTHVLGSYSNPAPTPESPPRLHD